MKKITFTPSGYLSFTLHYFGKGNKNHFILTRLNQTNNNSSKNINFHKTLHINSLKSK